MNNIGRKIEIFVIVAIIAAIGIVYAFTRPVQAPTNNQALQQAPISTIIYQGQDGQTALDLLKATHQVEAQHYSFGDMVESIDGQKADNKTSFWEFLVNDRQAAVGASAYVTKSSDVITWRLAPINATQ